MSATLETTRDAMLRTPGPFPSYISFRTVCREGLSAIRPLIPSARRQDPYGWNFQPAQVPSYQAYGRFRALYAFQQAIWLRPQRVLEVAAGDAALCASLAQATHCEVVANDLRSEHVAAAASNFSNAYSIRIISGNLFDLDPKDTGLFDLVIACEVIEHVAHTVDFLKQLKRFVTSDGKLLITTPNGDYFHNYLPTHSEIQDFEALESKQFKPDADGHLFLITPNEFRNLAAKAGLAVESIDVWGTPLITGHCGFRFLGGMGVRLPWYAMEALIRRLPFRLRSKLCFALSCVLTHRSGS